MNPLVVLVMPHMLAKCHGFAELFERGVCFQFKNCPSDCKQYEVWVEIEACGQEKIYTKVVVTSCVLVW